MREFTQETEGIFRLRVPFENLTTSVFLLLTKAGPVLYDCATTAEDVETVILPALQACGLVPQELRAVVLSHAHGDHSGGLMTLLQHAPELTVIARKSEISTCIPSDGEMLFGGLRALYLPGHTADCLGLLDLRTDTLLTADALQLQGIDRFGCSLTLPEEYVKTIEKIRCLAPRRLLTAHQYLPYGDRAEGTAEIARYLDGCLDVLAEIKTFVAAHRHLTAKEITEAFCAQHPHWPLLSQTTVKYLLK